MKRIPLYKFYKHKYGSELLIDVLDLSYIKKGIRRTPIHRESFFQIILFTRGSEEVTINERTHLVQPGEVACSRPGEVWRWNPDTLLEGYVLIFEEQFLLSFFNDIHFLEHFAYLQPDRPSPFLSPDPALQERLLHLFQQMKAEMEDRLRKDQHILRAMLYEFLMLLNRAESPHPTTQPLTETSASRYIDKFIQLADSEYKQHHEVEYYADKLCITSNYLNRLVSQYFGVSTKQYLNDKLTNEAKRLLAYTTLPISEITNQLNFDSPSYFVRFFRKATHSTPTEYRKEAATKGTLPDTPCTV